MTGSNLDLTLNSTDDPIPNLDAIGLSSRRSKRDKMVPHYTDMTLSYPSNIYELSYVTRLMYIPYFFIFRSMIIFSYICSLVLPAHIAQPIADVVAQTRAEDEALEEIPILQKKMKEDLKEVNVEQERIRNQVDDLRRRLQNMEKRREKWRAQAEKYKKDKAARDAKEQQEKEQAAKEQSTKKDKTEIVEVSKKDK